MPQPRDVRVHRVHCCQSERKGPATERSGIKPFLIDRADQVASSWRGRYDRLHLGPRRACSFATGYRRGLESLVGHLDVLDDRGMPRAVGESPAATGPRFLGYVPRPGAIGYAGKQAKRVAKAIAGELG